MTKFKNLFCTVLTHAAPSSNYRGESEENRTIIQKITKGDHEYAVVSPESMRNALRDILAKRELPTNRTRLDNYVGENGKPQLAVHFSDIPNADKFIDDFLFGYMVADPKKVPKWPKGHDAKRDSVLRMNMAVAVTPYRFDATFHQSPLHDKASAFQNAETSALLHREVSFTAYQYPFALNLNDCATKAPWGKALLAAIAELSNVAGGHARSYFEMAPRSLVARLTPSLVCGFDTYGFAADGGFPDLSRIREGDLPGNEFVV
ncbi:MAG: type I-B CRISPR-associated protein Cas7/Cst2/DevR, partial [Polyangiaceae bacterium]